ncbi:MAG: electron transport complex subunit RsxC [Clostridiales bacterium]|nr:electron transport complex subunit RsxC [Clostridiales bacterium]
MLRTFKGGLHVPDHKSDTNKIPTRKIDGAPVHIFPLHQHIGAMLDPKVKVGDYVRVGTVLADSDAYLTVPLHSSVSGTVTEIKPYFHPSGTEAMAIFVENDFKYETVTTLNPKRVDTMSPEEIVRVIRDAGIVGMGGAGFPTHAKLSPPKDKKVTHLIINAAECEPYLTSDHRRLLETPEKVVAGLRICMRLFGLDKGYIGIEANKPDAVEAIKSLNDSKIEIVELKTKYPQGSEKQLIKAVTGKSVPSGGLPVDVGAIVINVDTAYEISGAFEEGMPVVSRIITVAGDCIKEPCNLEVRMGTPFEFVINAAGGYTSQPKKLVNGGPMMGIAQFTDKVPTVKTTSAILALSESASVYDEDSPCIHCGKCVTHCPMRLMPFKLARYASEDDLEMCQKYHIMDCIECGLCSYLCPGRQGPVQNIRMAKQKIIENRRKK